MKKGFTLSEVLITLGVIGVVAAITLPSLITKCRRQEAATKLEKFHTIINQAVKMSIAEHGEIDLDNKNREDASNAEYIEKWYKENITKYIKTIKEEGSEKNSAYYKAAFVDGTGFNSFMGTSNPTTGKSNLYIFFCLNYKKCTNGSFDGKDTFAFAYSSDKKMVVPIYTTLDEDTLKQSCYNNSAASRHGCAALIQANGWKIPDDYPWIR